jgi:hypothetical protein
VVVTSPTRQALQEATFLRRQLAERDMPCVAVVVNRVLGRLPAARGGSGRVEVPPALRSRLVAIFRDHNALAAVEERGIRGLEVDCDCTALRVPELDDDASDLPELVAVAGALLSGRDATSRRRLP